MSLSSVLLLFLFFFFCLLFVFSVFFFFFQAEDGIRDWSVTGVQTCALPICARRTNLVRLRLGNSAARNRFPIDLSLPVARWTAVPKVPAASSGDLAFSDRKSVV